ncbi:MAG: DUF6445 family protein [Hyphomonas sp.]
MAGGLKGPREGHGRSIPGGDRQGCAITSGPSVTIQRIGQEGEPIAILDGFHDAPEELLARADGLSFGQLGPHYPGVRAPADAAYLARRMDLLQTLLSDIFGISAGANLVECNYSLLTTPPAELRPIQRLPHFDSTDPGRIAILHYLCGPECGGTAFYRHHSTGFETISDDRMEDYSRLLEEDIARRGMPAADYVRGDTEIYAQTFRVDAAFNRLIIYRGWTLHSGLIPEALPFLADPRAGRLTVNTFLQARQAPAVMSRSG